MNNLMNTPIPEEGYLKKALNLYSEFMNSEASENIYMRKLGEIIVMPGTGFAADMCLFGRPHVFTTLGTAMFLIAQPLDFYLERKGLNKRTREYLRSRTGMLDFSYDYFDEK